MRIKSRTLGLCYGTWWWSKRLDVCSLKSIELKEIYWSLCRFLSSWSFPSPNSSSPSTCTSSLTLSLRPSYLMISNKIILNIDWISLTSRRIGSLWTHSGFYFRLLRVYTPNSMTYEIVRYSHPKLYRNSLWIITYSFKTT